MAVKVVEKAHPNVFKIVKNFKKEQASTQVSLVQLATSIEGSSRGTK